MDSRTLFFLVLAVLVVLAALMVWQVLKRRRRERQLRELLDLADAVQALLARAGQRMAAWRGKVGRLAGDLASGAQRALDADALVHEAKRDLLQHRLWIQSKGLDASTDELRAAHGALARVAENLEAQLGALESAGDALTQATDAAHEAARREPAALRRGPEGGSSDPGA